MNFPHWRRIAFALLIVTVLATLGTDDARADARRFAYVYETTTMPQGLAEYEQWITWKTDKTSDDRYERLEFRQEIEYGLSDRVQVALYFADWRYTRKSSGSNTEVRDTAIEVMANVVDPATSAVGVALYGEIKVGATKFALEGKLLLEKDLGGLLLGYHAIVESEWEDEDWVRNKGELKPTAGLSWQASPKLLFGAEVLHEVELPDWSEAEDALFYAGPSVSLREGNVWVTTAALWQLTDVDGAAGLQMRALVGYLF